MLLVSQRPTFHWSWALCPQVSSGTTFNAINRSFIFRKCSTRGMLEKHVSILGSVSRLRMCERRQILNVRQLSECRRWVKEQVSRHYDVDDGVKPISSQQQQQSSWWIQLSAPQVNRYVLSFIIRIETFKFVSCYYIEIEVENNIEFERLSLILASELVEVMFIFDGCFAAQFDFVMCNTACAVKCC